MDEFELRYEQAKTFLLYKDLEISSIDLLNSKFQLISKYSSIQAIDIEFSDTYNSQHVYPNILSPIEVAFLNLAPV